MEILFIQDIESTALDSGTSELGCFRLEPEECSLIPVKAFEADNRFKLLELRLEGVPEFKNMRMIPPFVRELDPNAFKVIP